MKSADILADVKRLLQEQMQVSSLPTLAHPDPAPNLHASCCHRPTNCGAMQAVTYKWLARQYGLPANTAKQLLFIFFEQNRKLTKVH